jgi:hypothetical protein
MKDKLILVDCDGVLLDWGYAFDCWMNREGYTIVDSTAYDCAVRYNIDLKDVQRLIRFFNESASIGYLPPFRDAMYYIKRLHKKHGYVFHCITSLSHDPYAQKLRDSNLKLLFGSTAIEKTIYLGCGAPKHDVLDLYKGTECYWIEDKAENADVGHERGLNSILMAHDHNRDYSGPAIRLGNWEQIYNRIIGQ